MKTEDSPHSHSNICWPAIGNAEYIFPWRQVFSSSFFKWWFGSQARPQKPIYPIAELNYKTSGSSEASLNPQLRACSPRGRWAAGSARGVGSAPLSRPGVWGGGWAGGPGRGPRRQLQEPTAASECLGGS